MLQIAARDNGLNILQAFKKLAVEHGFQSIVFPLIGAGSGSFNHEKAKQVMLDVLQKLERGLVVKLVVFKIPVSIPSPTIDHRAVTCAF